MSKMTKAEIQSAIIAAQSAVKAGREGDTVSRDKFMTDLFVAAGYWPVSRNPSTAEFRGERVPVKMLRMPSGRAVRWERRWSAAEIWAAQI